MKSHNILILIPVLILLIINTAYSQLEQFPNEYNDYSKSTIAKLDSAGLDSFIMAKMSEYHIPGLSACIVRDGKILWNNNYGYSEISLNKMVNDSTSFLLASISKTIVCTALMQLWEDGLFNLDDNINNYLDPDLQVTNPYYPNDIITFRHLLTHTSSIDRDDGLLETIISWGNDSPISIDSFLTDYLMPNGQYYSWGPFQNLIPGTQWQYSNFALALSGYLVEILSDTTLDTYCNMYIFDPLKMFNTGWFLSDLDSNNIAIPYDYDGSFFQPLGYYGNPAYPCGWLKASARDLAHFLQMFMNDGKYGNINILDSTTVELIKTVQYPSFATWQGLIWFIYTLNGNLYCGHDGALPGCSTIMDFMIGDEDGLSVILLTNLYEPNGLMQIRAQLYEFGELYKKIYPLNVNLNSPFMNLGVDTLTITTDIVNPENHLLSVSATICDLDSTYLDTIPLFDDGNHDDSLAGDNLFGGYQLPLSFENEFIINLNIVDIDSGNTIIFSDISRFTTIGPIDLDNYVITSSDTVPNHGDRIKFEFSLKNSGLVGSANNVTSKLSNLDSCASPVGDIIPIYGNIEPNQTNVGDRIQYISFSSNCVDSIFAHFKIDIYSNDYLFWSDTFSVFVHRDPTEIEMKNEIISKEFVLKQNYPNPFNPVTNIEFSIPKTEFVTLKIYNLLGQEVTILVSDKLTSGIYKYTWDATKYASGIYYYRIQAGAFSQTRKLIVLK